MKLTLLHGWAVVDGYQPDGDTIRFVPDDFRQVRQLPRSHLVAVGTDTSVPVRLEGIDAPELHYEGREQPEARRALDALLREIHWPPGDLASTSHAETGRPRGVRIAVLTRACDSHGRVIGYVFGTGVPRAAAPALEQSVNARLLSQGVVYPLAYDTQPKPHRSLFARLALAARRAGAGIWRHDRSREGFPLRTEASLGAHGALVFPKIFRRAVTYFREARSGTLFERWLRDSSGCDDPVRVADGMQGRLSDLLKHRGGLIHMTHDPVGLTFVEAAKRS